jgi:tetratricopeptide (TPR) repeat protein
MALMAALFWGTTALGSTTTSSLEKSPPVVAQIEKMPIESWVIEHPTPSISPAHRLLANNGKLYILGEDQIRWVKGGYEEFKRTMIEVTDRSGLEDAAQIEISYDPSIASIVLNQLRIWRDGKIINHLEDTEPTILRREGQLDEGIVDGQLTVVLQLKDVRIGDIVDYSWTKKITKSMWPNHNFIDISAQWSVPVGISYFRMSWPSQYSFDQRSFKTQEQVKSHAEGKNTIYELTISDPAPLPAEKNVPAWNYQWGGIEMSTMSSWRDVVNWARPLYNGDLTLPPDFTKKIDTISRRFSKPEDRATEALRLVQDEIRYVGNEMGDGSYKPREPAKVISSGYGDCKDKSLLLVAALRSLGVKADVALANPSSGDGIAVFLPAPTVFNHAIVRAEISNAVYWLDPTLSHQGGRLPNIAIPDYGFVLPLTESNSQLEQIIVPAPSEPLIKATEDFSISKNDPIAMVLTSTTEWRGEMADYERNRFARNSPDDLNRHNLDYYAKHYPGIKAAQLGKTEDNREANIVTLTEKYTLSRDAFDAAKLFYKFPLRADAVLGLLPTPPANERRNPLYVPKGIYSLHEFHITFDSRILTVAKNVDRTVGPITFSEEWVPGSPAAVIRFTLKTDVNSYSVTAAQAPAVIKLANEIEDGAFLFLHIDKVAIRPAVQYKIDVKIIEPYENDLIEISSLLESKDKNKLVEALNKINLLQKKVPPKSELYGLVGAFKALSLVGLGRQEAALIEFDEALQYYHNVAAFYLFQAGLKIEKSDYLGAANALADLANLHPDEVSLITKEMLRYLLPKLKRDKSDKGREYHFQLILALTKANYKYESEWEPNQGFLAASVKGLFEHERIKEAQQMAEKLNTVDNIVRFLIDRRYTPIWENLEKRTGVGLQKITDGQIEILQRELKHFPKDLTDRKRYIHVLRLVGRNEDALKADDGLLTDMGRVEALGPDAFWILNDLGYTLFMMGRRTEGLAVFAKLKQLGVDRYPELISMNINFAILELENGDFTQALADADDMLGPSAPSMSPYGRAEVRSVRSCALREMGRTEEADKELKIIADTSNDNLESYVYTLACAGNGDRLEKVLQEMLENLDYRYSILLMVQNYAKPEPLTKFEQKNQKQIFDVLHRPALQARIKQLGRVIKLPGNVLTWGAF